MNAPYTYSLVAALLAVIILNCDKAAEVANADDRPNAPGLQEAESASASGNAVCYEILEGLKDGKIPLALQRVFTYGTSAVRFAANGKIEWFIADAAPGELPVGTVYNEGEVRFEPLRIRTRNDEPSVPVLFVSCNLIELTSGSRQLNVSFAVPSETEGSPFKRLDFGGGMTTAEEAHCYQYFIRSGEIRRCRPPEPGDFE